MNRSFKAPMKQIINHSNHQPNQSNKQTINRWIDQREICGKNTWKCDAETDPSTTRRLHTCCEHANMRKGKHFIQSHRLHKNVTVETECAFRTPKAARKRRPARSEARAKRALRAAVPIEVAALRAAGQAKARNQ